MGKIGADLPHQKRLALRQNIDMHQFCNMRPLSKAACMEIHFYVRNGACYVMQQHHPLAGAKFHKIHKPGCLGVEDDKQELLTQNLSTCQAAHCALLLLNQTEILVGQFSIDVEILCLCNVMLLSFDGPNFFYQTKLILSLNWTISVPHANDT